MTTRYGFRSATRFHGGGLPPIPARVSHSFQRRSRFQRRNSTRSRTFEFLRRSIFPPQGQLHGVGYAAGYFPPTRFHKRFGFIEVSRSIEIPFFNGAYSKIRGISSATLSISSFLRVVILLSS